jgi:hypothetical protein
MRRWFEVGLVAAIVAAVLGPPLLYSWRASLPLQGAEPEAQPVALSLPALDLPAGDWINTKPLRWSDLRGRVAVVHFWTFG